VTTRTLLLGDWNPWIRDPIDVVGALLPAAARAIAWLVRPLQLPRAYDAAFMVALMLQAGGEALGGVWEIWEWVSDHSFGSSLQLGLDDTVGDLVADTLGSLCGALLLVCWARYGWGSVRRVPGENRYEATEAG